MTIESRQSSTIVAPGYNRAHIVAYRGGWQGLLANESQSKALERKLAEVNSAGMRVVAAAEDRWSFWRRLLAALILVVTLGFVGKSPNLILITEPV